MSVCRKIFDEGVVLQAINSGTEILLSSKPNFVNIETDRVKLEIKTPEGTKNVESKLLCGADGAHSWVRRFFKMGRPKEMMIGFQIEVTGYEGDEGRLDMYTGRDIAPGYFAWAIPSGDSTRIGTWSRADLLNGFSCEDLIDRLRNKELWKHRFENITEIGRFVGPVPSGFVKKPMIERVALFGDAAGVCKPTTGGGIGPGFNQVDLLVPILSKSIINNDLSEIKMKKQSLVLVVIAAIVVIAGIFFITNQNIQKDVSDDQKKIGFIYIGPPGDHGWTYMHDVGRKYMELSLIHI